MVYRGRGNPRARGFTRPFRIRGRGRRPFPYRGRSRGFNHGGHSTEESLRITLRKPGRDRRDDHDGDFGPRSRSHERESERRDNYDDYNNDFQAEDSLVYNEESRFECQQRLSQGRDVGMSPPRKRHHVESDVAEEESLRITVGNDVYQEPFSGRDDSVQERRGVWPDERRGEQPFEHRRSEENLRQAEHYRDSPYGERHREWQDRNRGGRSPDSYRRHGREYVSRGDERYRGNDSYEALERGGTEKDYPSSFDRHRDIDFNSRIHHTSIESSDRAGRRRRSYSRERQRSWSRSRHSGSPVRRRSRSRSYGRERRDRSRGRRSLSRDRRSRSRDRRSVSRRRRSYSRGRRSSSRGRRSYSSSRSRSGSRRSLSRSVSRRRSLERRRYNKSRSPIPIQRGPSIPKSLGREIVGDVSGRDEQSLGKVPVSSNSLGPSQSRDEDSQSRGQDQRSQSRRRDVRSRSSSSSSSSSTGSRVHKSQSDMTEEQYEEEMYCRLKSELTSKKDPQEREDCIAKHIREMAKLSPVFFRQFMAKNAGHLTSMAMMQPEVTEHDVDETVNILHSERVTDSPNSKPLRSILKRKSGSASPSPDRTLSPPPQPPPALSQIEKLIQTLRKGGVRQEESKSDKESVPTPAGALHQLSSYMDIEEEEEFLYGDKPKTEPEGPLTMSSAEPFWSADRFEERCQSVNTERSGTLTKKHSEITDVSQKKQPFDIFEDFTSASQKSGPSKFPLAFGTFEEKDKSYEQWRASVFQKQTNKPKDSAPAQTSGSEGKESSEQLSSTVENILKSIGFNFELSQRMQELARQKKEEEHEAIKINQNASFLGSNSDALAEDLTSVFQKEPKPVTVKEQKRKVPQTSDFMKTVESATKIAREKALKAKIAEERHIRGPLHSDNLDLSKARGNDGFKVRKESERSMKAEMLRNEQEELLNASRKSSSMVGDISNTGGPFTAEHSPYDPNVQDYQHHQSFHSHFDPAEYGFSDFELYQGSEFGEHPKPIRTSNLIALGGDSETHDKIDTDRPGSFSDRQDKKLGDTSYKKTGDRILIVKKKEDKGKIDSPGSDSSFSRRIVLPPKEKSKPPPIKSSDSDSYREGKKRGASPESPKSFKHIRKSPSVENWSSDRALFQKSQQNRQSDLPETDSSRKSWRSPSPQIVFESKYKFETIDPKARSELQKSERFSKMDLMKAKIQQELPRPESKVGSIEDKIVKAAKMAQQLERTRHVETLEKELLALRQQYNELLRKRRRQKDGHRDPLLTENTKLQEEITSQIKALLEGKSPSTVDRVSLEKLKSSALKVSRESSKEEKKTEKETSTKINYEYFDPGSHWCSTCNLVCGHMFDFLKHLESKKHQQKLDPFNRPWLLDAMRKSDKKPKHQGQVQAHPVKGLEFMMATAAFYCSLCSEFSGDLSIAETHMKSEEHHEKYRDYLSRHPYYEKRLMLERSAALSMQKHASSDNEDKNSDDSSSEKNQSSEPKATSKSIESKRNKNESWQSKGIKKKPLYSDLKEKSSRSDAKVKETQKPIKESANRNTDSEDNGDSRKEKEDSKTSRDSKVRKENQESEKYEKKTVYRSVTGATSSVKTSADENDGAITVISDKKPVEKMEDKEINSEADGEDKEEDAKKEGDSEAKGKIAIKLTGKSGIKPVPTYLPWKAMTKPIPKSTAQKRLLASRTQLISTSSSAVYGPSLPNEDPIPLDDFLTVGKKKSKPVPVLPDLAQIRVPTAVSTPKQEEVVDKAKLEEMMMLGIDPKSLVPDVKPKPPPPPSQNLSMPFVKGTVSAESSKGGKVKGVKEVASSGSADGKASALLTTPSAYAGGQNQATGPPLAASQVPFSATPTSMMTPYSQPSVISFSPPSCYVGMYPGHNLSMPPLGFPLPIHSMPTAMPGMGYPLPNVSVPPPPCLTPHHLSHPQTHMSTHTHPPPPPPLPPLPPPPPPPPPPENTSSKKSVSNEKQSPEQASQKKPNSVETSTTQPQSFSSDDAVPENAAQLGAPEGPELQSSEKSGVSVTAPSDEKSHLNSENSVAESSSAPIISAVTSAHSEENATSHDDRSIKEATEAVVAEVPVNGACQSSEVSVNEETQNAVEMVLPSTSVENLKLMPAADASSTVEMTPVPTIPIENLELMPVSEPITIVKMASAPTSFIENLEFMPISEPSTTVEMTPVPISSIEKLEFMPISEPSTTVEMTPVPTIPIENLELMPVSEPSTTVEMTPVPTISIENLELMPVSESTTIIKVSSVPTSSIENHELMPFAEPSTTVEVASVPTSCIKNLDLKPVSEPIGIIKMASVSTSSIENLELMPFAEPSTTVEVASIPTMAIEKIELRPVSEPSTTVEVLSVPIISIHNLELMPVSEPSTTVEVAPVSTSSIENLELVPVSEPSTTVNVASEPAISIDSPECKSVAEPSSTDSEIALASDEAHPTSTQTFTNKKSKAQKKSTPASPSMRKRTRTQTQVTEQPQRQTRSRTRLLKAEEEEANVTASDEGSPLKSVLQEASILDSESGDTGKASSTSACVLDLTNPVIDSSSVSDAGMEVTSSSGDVKIDPVISMSPLCADSALNLTVSPQERGARRERLEQTMPEDLSSYAEPQDLSKSSADKSKCRFPPEMPIDLTMRLVPLTVDSSLSAEPSELEIQQSPGSQISSTEGLQEMGSLDPQTMKDTLLSSTSAANPSTNALSELEVGDEGALLESAPSQMTESPELGVDTQGCLMDFSLAPVDFEELADIDMEDSGASVAPTDVEDFIVPVPTADMEDFSTSLSATDTDAGSTVVTAVDMEERDEQVDDCGTEVSVVDVDECSTQVSLLEGDSCSAVVPTTNVEKHSAPVSASDVERLNGQVSTADVEEDASPSVPALDVDDCSVPFAAVDMEDSSTDDEVKKLSSPVAAVGVDTRSALVAVTGVDEDDSRPVSALDMEACSVPIVITVSDVEDSDATLAVSDVEDCSTTVAADDVDASSALVPTTDVEDFSAPIVATDMEDSNATLAVSDVEDFSASTPAIDMEDLSAPVAVIDMEDLSAPVAVIDMEDLSAPVAVTDLEDCSVPVAVTDLEDCSAPVAVTDMEDLSAPVAVTDLEDYSAPVAVTDLEDCSAPLINNVEDSSGPLVKEMEDFSGPVAVTDVVQFSNTDATTIDVEDFRTPDSSVDVEDFSTPVAAVDVEDFNIPDAAVDVEDFNTPYAAIDVEDFSTSDAAVNVEGFSTPVTAIDVEEYSDSVAAEENCSIMDSTAAD